MYESQDVQQWLGSLALFVFAVLGLRRLVLASRQVRLLRLPVITGLLWWVVAALAIMFGIVLVRALASPLMWIDQSPARTLNGALYGAVLVSYVVLVELRWRG